MQRGISDLGSLFFPPFLACLDGLCEDVPFFVDKI